MKKINTIIVLILLIISNSLYSQENNYDDKIETILICASGTEVLIIYPDNKIEKYIPKPRTYEAALLHVKEKMDFWLNDGYELSQLSDSSVLIIVLVKRPKQ